MTGDRLAGRIAAIVGGENVLLEPGLKAPFERDWTGRFAGRADLVVRPGTTDEVAAVVRLCASAGVAIVPQGGNTGMVGGAVPDDGEVVLSLLRLAEIEPVDILSAQVTAGAGATLGAVQRHVRAAGLELGLDHGARDSATVGGAVATNAGGTRALRYGTTRANVAGLEAVLASGRVLRRLSGLAKDNAGYDLPSLIVGSEGTLAVVTRVRLRLVSPARSRATVLCGVDSTDAAIELLAALRPLEALESCELFYAAGLELVRRRFDLPLPLSVEAPAYVLVECAGQGDLLPELAAIVGDVPGVVDTAAAEADADRAQLWRYRELHTEAVQAQGVPHKLDVSVPVRVFPSFVRGAADRVADIDPEARTIVYGHLGDGNLHVNVLGLAPDDERVDDAVLHLVAELGGSVSAEHGIGIAKRRWLRLTRSDEEIEAMRAVKRALDPASVLNPRVLFPPLPGGDGGG